MAGRQSCDMVRHGRLPLTDSYIHTAAQDAGAVAELAAALKTAKYAAQESR